MSALLPPGMRVAWLGHATVHAVTPTGARLLIDPWTYANPSCPAPRKNPGPIDLMLITHGHSDHMGDALKIALDTGCRIVALYEIALHLMAQGIPAERVLPVNRGGTLRLPDLGLSVTTTVAHHSGGIDENGVVTCGGEPAGFVVTLDDGFAFYHAGDTAVFSDMRLIADLYAPRLAMLPIGDRFTMGPREAALAMELLHSAQAVLPLHWGTFPLLTGTPAHLEAEMARRGVTATVLTPAPGQEIG